MHIFEIAETSFMMLSSPSTTTVMLVMHVNLSALPTGIRRNDHIITTKEPQHQPQLYRDPIENLTNALDRR